MLGLKKTEHLGMDSKRDNTSAWTQKDRIPMHGCINIRRLWMDSKLEDTYAWAHTDMGPLNWTQKYRTTRD